MEHPLKDLFGGLFGKGTSMSTKTSSAGSSNDPWNFGSFGSLSSFDSFGSFGSYNSYGFDSFGGFNNYNPLFYR